MLMGGQQKINSVWYVGTRRFANFMTLCVIIIIIISVEMRSVCSDTESCLYYIQIMFARVRTTMNHIMYAVNGYYDQRNVRVDFQFERKQHMNMHD